LLQSICLLRAGGAIRCASERRDRGEESVTGQPRYAIRDEADKMSPPAYYVADAARECGRVTNRYAACQA